ncbi:IclR family transcriptional regulator [Ramlibacter tataouinensis]|uniref:Transcriptional regulator, IclR family-like protein n=1 Tax=Ramlibacter tataouinensis (strain ATCC BAA-407 / DSM 14655 / LMG 21543 / TTB310) TaxID=365046 RepID=F5Y444_RAMTT|nr:IclR family transcriptional regulator [Ramlibacter tataouinensis]AEG92509.1 transcriptional regulator, IclR family-like protein [Ramlibacter tataouinensis TTB310]
MNGPEPTPPDKVALTRVAPDMPYGKAVGSLHRSLEVLELFAVEQRALTVGEVAQQLGYPQSSTSVLLHNLSELGYLQHDRHARTFLPTLRVSFLGMWLHQRVLAQGNLLDFMEMLASRSGHVAMLAMQNGIHAQYIHIVSARTSRVGLKPGLLRPICRSAVGKVLLSTMADDEILRIVRNVNATDVSFPQPVDGKALLKEVAECRRTGFAFSVDAVTPGSSVIAARVPVDVGGQPLAVGIGVHTWQRQELQDTVMALLREALGTYFPPGSGETGRPRIQPPQAGYAVVKTS